MGGSVFSCFFQAEDGIRDLTVTGVQTCALPIFRSGIAWILPINLATKPIGETEKCNGYEHPHHPQDDFLLAAIEATLDSQHGVNERLLAPFGSDDGRQQALRLHHDHILRMNRGTELVSHYTYSCLVS